MPTGETLAIDMYETADSVVVKTAVPGVKPEDIDITITGNSLTIAGETKAEEKVEEENYIRRERRYGRFSRSVTLPSGVQGEKAEATFDHALLTPPYPRPRKRSPRSSR